MSTQRASDGVARLAGLGRLGGAVAQTERAAGVRVKGAWFQRAAKLRGAEQFDDDVVAAVLAVSRAFVSVAAWCVFVEEVG